MIIKMFRKKYFGVFLFLHNYNHFYNHESRKFLLVSVQLIFFVYKGQKPAYQENPYRRNQQINQ